MWLDRRPGQHPGSAAPPPNNRSVSPLPQRTSSRGPYLVPQRPGLNTRGSSALSLVSNDSSSSLLASAKKANGSSLRQSSTVDDAPDPEEVLARILGQFPSSNTTQQPEAKPASGITEDDLDFDVDFGSLTLTELAGPDVSSRQVDNYEPQSVHDYERDKAKFEDLHRSIRACDDILSSVESNLTNFRNDLAAVSADIESLQARSQALNVRLENRKAVEKGLGPLVDELSVSPLVITTIVEGYIDETWVKVLAEVDKRAMAHKKNAQQPQSKALADVGPLLEKLILKAIERIRDFLVAQIKAMRSPHINAQIIQQQNFLRFKDLFAFLQKHQPTLAGEICQAYMNTMRWYYLNQFTRYKQSLDKLKLHIIDKNDAMGHEDTSRRTTVLSGSKLGGVPHDAFSIGRRNELLKTKDQIAMSSYLADEDQTTHYLEVPFRNFNLALVDNATAEYTFLVSFFSPALSLAAVSRHFSYIFDPTFALGQVLTKQLVSDTYDGLGLLLCVRLNQHFAFELQRRRVPVVDGYINGTAMVLWPRLQSVMDAHCESVKALTSALPNKVGSASQAKTASAAPHVVTQRFGQFLHGVLALSTEAGDDEPIVSSLHRLRIEVEAFLAKYSQAQLGADARKRDRFLYNNYSLILTIISDVSGKLATEQQDHFESLKASVQENI
ncbi:Vps52-domain-containing protein [Neurospora crassa]|uniref:Vps52/Sac2 family protein n=1 Tax=Neurospora crassa (strain ATCC 24698 / 74-OR23-1A / CBS 708.71 / DSM 1257 / FGSC 987) TaxID=367110 RepID=Q7S8L0_NEUCR|nr:Vps52/Sac2 family protein [Neurospora crassa OR74A]EAA32674.2 Vps52/Sac2 family protein [Neurospora crassa OR74A]KHE84974.1 Vps52-domain-containing protein [Neurospora crassa]|eukprot:XP_961910.2 Vps52/Sac2 family protein [Neurospora crassa OR74A]